MSFLHDIASVLKLTDAQFRKDMLQNNGLDAAANTYQNHLMAALNRYLNGQNDVQNPKDVGYRCFGKRDIKVRMYAYRGGLKGALRDYRSEFTAEDLERLFVSFAAGPVDCDWDFIDAGPGPDKADELIRSTSRQSSSTLGELLLTFGSGDCRKHVKDSNCVKILLGCCHDVGYFDRLDFGEYRRANLPDSRRISLLTCHSTLPIYYRECPFEIISFPHLFQDRALKAGEGWPAKTKAYTGTLPMIESPLVKALKAEDDARKHEESKDSEIARLTSQRNDAIEALSEARQKIQELSKSREGLKVKAKADRNSMLEAKASLKRLEEDRLALSGRFFKFMTSAQLCDPEKNVQALYRDSLQGNITTTSGFPVYVKYPSGVHTMHHIEPYWTISTLRQKIEEELGVPTAFQQFKIGRAHISTKSTFQSLSIGADSCLTMAPCFVEDLLDLIRSRARNDWVATLNGGWGGARAYQQGEVTGSALPKLTACKRCLTIDTRQETTNGSLLAEDIKKLILKDHCAYQHHNKKDREQQVPLDRQSVATRRCTSLRKTPQIIQTL